MKMPLGLIIALVSCLATAASAIPIGPQLEFVGVDKQHVFNQVNAATVVEAADDTQHFSAPYRFNVRVEGQNLQDMAAPTFGISAGNGQVPALVYNETDQAWSYKAAFGSQTLLNNAYGNGTYTISVGDFTTHLALSGDAYPTTPMVTASAGTWQNGVLVIDPAQGLTLTSNTFANFLADGSLAHIGFSVAGPALYANVESFSDSELFPDYSQADSVSLIFNPGDFVSGQTYKVHLEFNQAVMIDTTTIPGALAVAIYTNRLQFAIQAGAAIPEPATCAIAIGALTLGLAVVRRRRVA